MVSFSDIYFGVAGDAAGGSGEDAVVTAWAAAIATNGGTISAATRSAANTLVGSLKAKSSLWTKVNNGTSRLSVMAGIDRLAGLVPLIRGGGGAADTGNNIVNGDYTLAGGFKGNASNKTVDVNCTEAQAAFTSTDGCIAAWFTGTDTGVKVFLSTGASGKEFYLAGAGNWVWDGSSGPSTSPNALETASYQAQFAMSAVAGSFMTYRRASPRGIAAVHGTVAGSSVGTTKLRLLGRAGGAFQCNNAASGYYIGAGLTDQEMFDLNAAMEAFYTAIGRSVTDTGYDTALFGDSTILNTGIVSKAAALVGLSTGRMSFNGGVSGETSTQITARILASPLLARAIIIVEMGTNDYSTPATVLANYAAIATAMAAAGNPRFIFHTPQSHYTATAGYPVTADHANIMTVVNGLIAAYPNNYIDTRALQIAAYDPGTPQDVLDHTNDCMPSTLRLDSSIGHPNAAACALVAAADNSFIIGKGW